MFQRNRHIMGRLAKSGLAACAVAVLLAAAPARAADQRSATLEYVVLVGGFEAVRISFDAAFDADEYRMKMALDGRGILDWWFAWTVRAFSEGKLANGAVEPVRSGSDSHWNGRMRQTRLIYASGEAPDAVIRPPEEDGERDVVPPALRAGALDPASAIFAGLSGLIGSESCTAREKVFDGLRRYNLVLGHLGQDVLKANDYSPFAGPALRCSIKVERIAGYNRKFNSSRWRRWRKTDGAKLWIGRAFENFPPVPVRLELDTDFGGLWAYLVRATLKEGGRVHRLALAR